MSAFQIRAYPVPVTHRNRRSPLRWNISARSPDCFCISSPRAFNPWFRFCTANVAGRSRRYAAGAPTRWANWPNA
ncbi:MAG: hypothetical protein A2Y38_00755 [Spirochaetes bacterium GWB1_59_5]|nr:MAG: hypothetical protein A2Y38_00755 [Spirochaetes bacterium GWB1_59_5]